MSSPKLLIDFLEKNTSDFLKSWLNNLFISPDDVYFHRIKENGISMYELVKRNLLNPLSEEENKQLAFKVAEERVKANINIGDFVYHKKQQGSTLLLLWYVYTSDKLTEVQQ